MKHLLVFYYMLFTFGLAPFTMNINKKKQKIESFMTLLPTISMTVLYSLCIGSLFWQGKGKSEIAYTANWIQVMMFQLFFYSTRIELIQYKDITIFMTSRIIIFASFILWQVIQDREENFSFWDTNRIVTIGLKFQAKN